MHISFILVLLLTESLGLQNLDLFRMIGYEQDKTWIGSKISTSSMLTTHYLNPAQRKISWISFKDMSGESLDQLLNNKPSGVLMIIQKVHRERESQIWKLIFEKLAPRGQTMPIYFTYETNEILQHYTELQNQPLNEFMLQSTGGDSKPVNLQLEDFINIYDMSQFKQNSKTTLIVVGLDAQLPSADLQITSDQVGVQLSLFFQIARQIKPYLSANQKRDRNIIFYLSTSTKVDNFGIKQFFKKQEYQRYTNTIDNIIVLDTIHTDQVLKLEYDPNSDDQTLFNLLTQQLKDHKYTYQTTIQSKDLLESNKDIRIIRLYSEEDQTFLTTELDGGKKTQLGNVISQSLLELLLNSKIPQVVHLQDDLFDQHLSAFLDNNNRFITNLQKDTQFSQDMHNLLKQIFKHTVKTPVTLKDRKYYTSQPVKAQLFKFVSAFVDLYLICAVALWLVVVYGGFKYVTLVPANSNKNKK